MVTGLLFSLASRPPMAANDVKAEGNTFPPPPKKRRAPRQNTIALIKHVAIVMALTGLVMLGYGASNWSFDPNGALNIQTAFINFTLNMGAFS